MNEWYLVEPIKIEKFNQFLKQNDIVKNFKVKRTKYLSLLLDGKKVK